jgi:hypothetical protein
MRTPISPNLLIWALAAQRFRRNVQKSADVVVEGYIWQQIRR